MLFEHGFYLTKPIWALICLHDITQESVATLTDHFADAFAVFNLGNFKVAHFHLILDENKILPNILPFT